MKQITKKEIEKAMANMTFNLSNTSFNAFIVECVQAFKDASVFNSNLEYNGIAEFQSEMAQVLAKLLIDKGVM